MKTTPMTLGKLIEAVSEAEPDGWIRFDFMGLTPKGIDSYRGYYDQLAIGYEEGGAMRVADFLAMCRSAIGKTFHGYKGGNYRMDANTNVWVGNYGHCAETAIVGVEVDGSFVKLKTACVP